MSRQDFKTIESVLKECYLPAWDNQIGITPSAFMAEIEKSALEGGKEIYAAAEIGLSGGFGFGAEGTDNAPKAGGQQFNHFTIPIRDMYCTIEISDKAIKLSQDNSLVNAFDTEVTSAYKAAEWNVGRALFGDGSGKLATTNAASNMTTFGVDDITRLKEGLIVDVYADTDETTPAATVRILSINRTDKEITVDKAIATSSTGYLTVQNSKDVELTGLGAIMKADGTLYGLNKEAYPYLKPTTHDCGSLGVTDLEIGHALRLAKREKNGNINMLLCSDDAYDSYIKYLRETNQRVDNNIELEGGFKAIKYSFGSTDVAVVNEGFVPAGEIWGVNTKDFEFKKTAWDFVTKDGSAFERISGSSNLQALLASYGNLVCKNPGGCVRFINCAI